MECLMLMEGALLCWAGYIPSHLDLALFYGSRVRRTWQTDTASALLDSAGRGDNIQSQKSVQMERKRIHDILRSKRARGTSNDS